MLAKAKNRCLFRSILKIASANALTATPKGSPCGLAISGRAQQLRLEYEKEGCLITACMDARWRQQGIKQRGNTVVVSTVRDAKANCGCQFLISTAMPYAKVDHAGFCFEEKRIHIAAAGPQLLYAQIRAPGCHIDGRASAKTPCRHNDCKH